MILGILIAYLIASIEFIMLVSPISCTEDEYKTKYYSAILLALSIFLPSVLIWVMWTKNWDSKNNYNR